MADPTTKPARGGNEMTGIERIAAERKRQIEVEGWTAEHDDDDEAEENGLAWAAVVYATPPEARSERLMALWPWDSKWWKPGERIRELEKAGALISAEIDRLLRKASR